jgi:hypothetical protein
VARLKGSVKNFKFALPGFSPKCLLYFEKKMIRIPADERIATTAVGGAGATKAKPELQKLVFK